MAQVPANNLAKTNGTTAVDIVPAPAAATQRLVRCITCFNNDTVQHDVIVQVTDGTNTSIIDRQTIPVNGRYIWGTDRETQVLDSTTKKMQVKLAEVKVTS